MIEIKLYTTSDENNKLNKTLSNELTINAVLKTENEILMPILDLSIAYVDIKNMNYVYIPIFNRYYFITSMKIINNNIVRINLKCDVLMSHKDEILRLSCVIGRSSSNYNAYFSDSEFSCYNNPRIQTKVFPNYNVFNQGRSYLITVSGRGN